MSEQYPFQNCLTNYDTMSLGKPKVQTILESKILVVSLVEGSFVRAMNLTILENLSFLLMMEDW